MIKKIFIILFSLLLVSCSVNKKNLYHIKVNGEEIIVGYSKKDNIFTSFDDYKIDEEGVLTSGTFYIKDYNEPIYIDDVELSLSIVENCALFEGYMSNDACVIEKKVSGRINRIVLYNNILNDNLDELDHITLLFIESD